MLMIFNHSLETLILQLQMLLTRNGSRRGLQCVVQVSMVCRRCRCVHAEQRHGPQCPLSIRRTWTTNSKRKRRFGACGCLFSQSVGNEVKGMTQTQTDTFRSLPLLHTNDRSNLTRRIGHQHGISRSSAFGT
jgi:hypothetical protein